MYERGWEINEIFQLNVLRIPRIYPWGGSKRIAPRVGARIETVGGGEVQVVAPYTGARIETNGRASYLSWMQRKRHTYKE